MITVSKDINYISASLTLRCNLRCQYCINDYTTGTKTVSTSNEISGKEWLKHLNSMNLVSSDLPITIEGGEPSLHRDFYEIIDGSKHKINILTNLTFSVNEFVKNVDTRKIMRGVSRAFKPIRVSYHALTMDMKTTVEKTEYLQESGFGVGIFGINYPEHVDYNISMAEECRKKQIYFYIKDYLGYYNGRLLGIYKYPDSINSETKKCKCKSNELLIGPNGNIYKCHRDMYANNNHYASIDSDSTITPEFRECELYGKCNPCDVKLKTNRFLNYGNCSVEIIPV